jgi:hypothetical protein
MIEAGELAAEAVLPQIRNWLKPAYVAASMNPLPAELVG